MTWDEIKEGGSQHYKNDNGGAELIDVFRDLKPHEDLTALEVKALTDVAKYACRMLKNGTNLKDLQKIQHYTSMCQWRIM